MGFTGKKLVDFLVRSGETPIMLVRSKETIEEGEIPPQVEVMTLSEFRERITDFDVQTVFHLATTYIYTPSETEITQLINSNIELPVQIAQILSNENKSVDWINVSTFMQHYESLDYSPTSIYAATKQAAEDLLKYYEEYPHNDNIEILDLIEKDNQSAKDFEKYIKKQCEPYTDVPIVFMSVLNKQRIYKAIETAVEVYQNRTKKIKTSTLNDTMLPIIQHTSPPQYKGKYIKIKYITQLPTPWPSFAFFANLPQYVKEPYKRFLENQLRKEFDFHGVPVTVFIRKK